MGLIQREVEQVGIPTVGISIARHITEQVKPPRSVFLPSPLGHPLGEPQKPARQKAILKNTLEALHTIKTPGQIIDLNGF